MGWNAENKGLEFDAVNPELKKFFDMVGVSEHQLRDQETREFIYNFIESHGGMNAVKEVVLPSTKSRNANQPPVLPQRQEYPPPVPARTITVSNGIIFCVSQFLFLKHLMQNSNVFHIRQGAPHRYLRLGSIPQSHLQIHHLLPHQYTDRHRHVHHHPL